jgi:hypothetical protein
VAIAAVFFVDSRQRRTFAQPDAQTPSTDTLDRLVIDYAFQTMQNQLARDAVASCGVDLSHQEADVSARVTVEAQNIRISKVRFTRNEWTPERLACVTGVFEGRERRPSSDGINTRFPEGSEYEFDAHLDFAAPALQYTQ